GSLPLSDADLFPLWFAAHQTFASGGVEEMQSILIKCQLDCLSVLGHGRARKARNQFRSVVVHRREHLCSGMFGDIHHARDDWTVGLGLPGQVKVVWPKTDEHRSGGGA